MIIREKTDIEDLPDDFNSNGWSLSTCLEVKNFCLICLMGLVNHVFNFVFSLWDLFFALFIFIILVLKSFVVLQDDWLSGFYIVLTLSIFIQKLAYVMRKQQEFSFIIFLNRLCVSFQVSKVIYSKRAFYWDAVGGLASVRSNEIIPWLRIVISTTLGRVVAPLSTAQLSILKLLTTAIKHADDITTFQLGYDTELSLEIEALFLIQ